MWTGPCLGTAGFPGRTLAGAGSSMSCSVERKLGLTSAKQATMVKVHFEPPTQPSPTREA